MKTENEPRVKRCRRTASFGFPIYPVRGLQKGNRPSFVKAGSPQHANELYEYIIDACKREVPVVKTGVFGAEMEVALINDGPFTIILDSKDLA